MGQISTFEFVLINEWYRAVKNDPEKPTYGILAPPTQSKLSTTNALREIVFLRPIEVHNKLVVLEEKTGMDFYLEGHPWTAGRIEVR